MTQALFSDYSVFLFVAASISIAAFAFYGKKFFSRGALALALLLSLSSHSLVLAEWHMPTFGNTMIHVANARHAIEFGDYPIQADYSYGGGPQGSGLANTYVPAYRLSLAALTLLFGIPAAQFVSSAPDGFGQLDVAFDASSRLLVLLFGLLLTAGFYLLARHLFGELAGVVAALFSVLPAETLIYTVRPLPQAFGLALLPFAFLELCRGNFRSTLLLAVLVAMVHQEAAAFFAAACFAYGVFLLVFAERQNSFKKIVLPAEARLAFLAWLACSAAYLLWQVYTLGHANFFELAQFKYHEGAPAGLDLILSKSGLALYFLSLAALPAVAYSLLRLRLAGRESLAATGLGFLAFGALFGQELSNQLGFGQLAAPAFAFPLAAGFSLGQIVFAIGVAVAACALALFFSKGFSYGQHSGKQQLPAQNNLLALVFLAALLAAGLALVKNDLVGIRVFMDRFVVFLQQPMIVASAWLSSEFLRKIVAKAKWN